MIWRSFMVVDAQMPQASLFSKACLRHSVKTGQVSQKRCAFLMEVGRYIPSWGAPKNSTSSMCPRQLAWTCHLGQSLSMFWYFGGSSSGEESSPKSFSDLHVLPSVLVDRRCVIEVLSLQ